MSQKTQIFKKTRGYWLKRWIKPSGFLTGSKKSFLCVGAQGSPQSLKETKIEWTSLVWTPTLIGTYLLEPVKNTLYDSLWYWKKSVLIAPWHAAGPVTNWYIFAFSDEDSTSFCSTKTASGPNRVHPLSSGKSFAQKEKKAHSELEAQRAWQASAEISTERGALRTSSIGWYFTFSLIQPGSFIVWIISGLFAMWHFLWTLVHWKAIHRWA